MKTKNKILALLEIAVVLCSVFLVALPAVAADQTTQKVSTTASEDDFTLYIYGNANEDDTIDGQDVVYIKLVIFGKKPETDLADANYDGKVSMLDVGQTKLIILGRESELTIVDAEGAAKTVSKPVEEIIVLNSDCAQAIRAIGAKDRIVGIEGFGVAKKKVFFPDISELPTVGWGHMPDLEEILALEPDILIAYAPGIFNPGHEGLEDKLEPAVTVVRLDLYRAETIREEMLKLGYLLDEEENAREYVEWHDEYADEIEDIVSGISEDDKPQVFLDWGTKHAGESERDTVAKGSASHKRCEKAGGINIAADFPMPYLSVGLEWILAPDQNPEIIIGCSEGYNQHGGGYETDDESELREYYDEIIGLPGFENKKVYIITHEVTSGPGYLVGLAYHGQWFHPKLFSDLDPQEMHQEYVDEFCGIDFDVREQGVFVYQKPAS